MKYLEKHCLITNLLLTLKFLSLKKVPFNSVLLVHKAHFMKFSKLALQRRMIKIK